MNILIVWSGQEKLPFDVFIDNNICIHYILDIHISDVHQMGSEKVCYISWKSVQPKYC